MKITSCWLTEPQNSIKIAFCSVFKLSLLKAPLRSHGFFCFWNYSNRASGIIKKKTCNLFPYMKYKPSKLKKYTKVKIIKNFKMCKSTIMDFQTPKFLEFALLNNHYQISKNEGNQNFKLSVPAWFLQKLTLKFSNKPWYCYNCSKNLFPFTTMNNFNKLQWQKTIIITFQINHA